MDIIGIVCEYNPFHNGHIYHINKIKEMFPNSLIICVTSTYFTMRGEISLLNKWDKSKLCIDNGIDLVIELPTYYSVNSSDIFAYGSVKLLSLLKCNYIVFGSEIDDINILTNNARIQIDNNDYDKLVKEYLDLGNNYPTSMNKALVDLGGSCVNTPNDLLGLSYIKQILINNYSITPISIKRTNDYHEKKAFSNITSASSIRDMIDKGIDITSYVPSLCKEFVIKDNVSAKYFELLKYKIISDIDNLSDYLDVSEGLDNRIRKYIYKASNYNELVELVKTKRYTYNRINRMFLHILLNIKNSDNYSDINYIRLLGFSNLGRDYIKSIKDNINIDIITNYSQTSDKNMDFELRCSSIYSMIVNDNDLIIRELKSIPIKE